jgi:hypothetical protein
MNIIANGILYVVTAVLLIFVFGNDSNSTTNVNVTEKTPTFILCNYFPENDGETVVYGKHIMFQKMNLLQIEEYKLNHIKNCNSFWQVFEEILYEEELVEEEYYEEEEEVQMDQVEEEEEYDNYSEDEDEYEDE